MLAFANSQTFIFFVIRPSDYGEFTPESSSPAEPSRVGPRGELDTGWGLRFLKFPYFCDWTLEFNIFFYSFRTRPPEARDRWLHAGPRGELDQGESSTWGWVFFFFFFFFNSGNFVLFAIRPSESSFFFPFVRARTPDPREVWFHDVPRDELEPGAGFPVAGLR